MSNEPRQNPIDAGALGNCPVPLAEYERMLLGHGSGGKLSADLLKQVFLPALGNDVLDALEDQATLDLFATTEVGSANGNGHRPAMPRLAFTTDSFVVRPLFFPGGNIGQLAVHGTINDLAVAGRPPGFCRRPSSWKRAFRSTTCAASPPRCATPAARPASCW